MLMAALAVSLLLAGCGLEEKTDSRDDGNNGNGQSTEEFDPANSCFIINGIHPAFVTVSLNGKDLYKYEFVFDTYSRLRTFKLSDGETLVRSASVTPVSEKEHKVNVNLLDGSTSDNLSVRWTSDCLVWAHTDCDNPNRYVTACDGVVPTKFYYNTSYSGTKYTGTIQYAQHYTMDGGNVKSRSYAPVATSTGEYATTLTGDPVWTDSYEYCPEADRSNVGAFFTALEFLPEYMKGLPGNKNLISKITRTYGEADRSDYTSISYELDSATEAVRTATVKVYRKGTLLYTYVYKFTY